MSVVLTEYIVRGYLIEDKDIIKTYLNKDEDYDFEDLYNDNPYENKFEKGRCFLIFDGMSGKYLVFGEICNKFNYNSYSPNVIDLNNQLWTLDDNKILESFLEYSSKYQDFYKSLNLDSFKIKTIFLRHFH